MFMKLWLTLDYQIHSNKGILVISIPKIIYSQQNQFYTVLSNKSVALGKIQKKIIKVGLHLLDRLE